MPAYGFFNQEKTYEYEKNILNHVSDVGLLNHAGIT